MCTDEQKVSRLPRREPAARHAASERTERVVLAVAGMGCDACANRVFNGLVETMGVVRVSVDRSLGRALVEYDPTCTSLAGLLAAVERAGRSSGHTYRAALAPDQGSSWTPARGAWP